MLDPSSWECIVSKDVFCDMYVIVCDILNINLLRSSCCSVAKAQKFYAAYFGFSSTKVQDEEASD